MRKALIGNGGHAREVMTQMNIKLTRFVSDEYWEENRFENLNKDEKGIYKMLDTLQT